MNVLVTADDFRDLAFAYLTKAASQGVRHVEMFFDPQAHTGRGVPFDTVISGYRQAIVAGPRRTRHLGRADHVLPARPVGRVRDGDAHGVAAATRTGSSASGSTPTNAATRRRKFAAVFARARARGLPAHDALRHRPGGKHRAHPPGARGHRGRPHRPRHEHRRVDPRWSRKSSNAGIGLTCCPISNRFVTDDMKAKEIVRLLHDGVRVTVNSDDPAYFAGLRERELRALGRRAPAQRRPDIVRLARNAFEIAWLTPRAVRGLHRGALCPTAPITVFRDRAAEAGVLRGRNGAAVSRSWASSPRAGCSRPVREPSPT